MIITYLGYPPPRIKKWIEDDAKSGKVDLGPLCFTAQEANSEIKLRANEEEVTDGYFDDDTGEYVEPEYAYSFNNIKLKVSFDGTTWRDFSAREGDDVSETINLVNVGDKVYFKADGTNESICSWDYALRFEMQGEIAASGNIQYLIDETGQKTDVPEVCYHGLFAGCYALTTAPALPATTLGKYCYGSMFDDCRNLTAAPELPATVMKDYCYSAMFKNCWALTTAPELKSTQLAEGCYRDMFNRCKNLTVASALPAEYLAQECYFGMYAATGITTAPALNSKHLAIGCYQYMFDFSALTTAPELPATELAEKCYDTMFASCPNLTTAPALIATTLARSCYSAMFQTSPKITEVHMKSSMVSVFDKSVHGELKSGLTPTFDLD